MLSLVPICFGCARFRNLTAGLGLTCDAFPDKAIPVEVLASRHDHRKPYPGDGGLQYIPREDQHVTDKAPIRAFHGSPYNFEKFLASHIGSGEGHEDYGYGLYFGDLEAVARYYRDKLTLGGGPPGHIYEVAIEADPAEMLDWDRPLNQQSAVIQKIGRTLGLPDNPATGQELYQALAGKRGSPAAAARTLQRLGIPGIRYLDQLSRALGKGTHNYVVFDPDAVSIVRKFAADVLGSRLDGARILAAATLDLPRDQWRVRSKDAARRYAWTRRS